MCKKSELMKTKIWGSVRKRLLPEAYRLKLYEKKRKRELEEEIRRAKASGNKDAIEWAKTDYNSELFQIYEQQEALFTKQLIAKANRFRVHVPAKPKWTYEDGFEENEDWDGIDDLYLTNKGSARIEEEIEKKKKWRRERWAFIVQCTSGLARSRLCTSPRVIAR